MPTFIKPGFWEKAVKGYKEWFNLDAWFEKKKGYKTYVANLGCTSTDQIGPKYVLENSIGNVTFSTTGPGFYAILLPENIDINKLYVNGVIISDNVNNLILHPVYSLFPSVLKGYVTWYAGFITPGLTNELNILMYNPTLSANQSWRTTMGENPGDATVNGTTGLFIEIRIYD